MILRNIILCSICVVVFVICDVNATDDQTHTKKKSKQKSKNKADTNALAAKLNEIMEIRPQPLITVSAPLIFEGVDYELLYNLSTKAYHEHYDCFYWFTKCVRDLAYFQAVCVYYYSIHWVNYSNICQVELDNCKHRTAKLYWKESQGLYGEHGTNYYDYSWLRWYSGDGWNCKYYFRRNVPDDRVNFYYENQNQEL